MEESESRTNVTPETCTEFDSVSGVYGTNYQVFLLTKMGKIADEISISLRFFCDDGRVI